MRQRPKALGFAILLAPLAALHVGSPAQAASVALKCRRACHDRIAGCVAAGSRRGPCRKSMLGRCKREGVAVCQGQAGATTTSTTTPTTTTTLTGGGFLSGLVTDPTVVLTEPETPRPAYELPVRPTVFHVPIMRIANDPGLPTLPVSGTWGSDARHVYSKQQPWSADESLISIENSGGPSPLILDGFTNLPKYAPCSNYDLWDYRWHPSRAHPHEQINVDSSGTRLSWFDGVSCNVDVPREFVVNSLTLALSTHAMSTSSYRWHGTAAGFFLCSLGQVAVAFHPFAVIFRVAALLSSVQRPAILSPFPAMRED